MHGNAQIKFHIYIGSNELSVMHKNVQTKIPIWNAIYENVLFTYINDVP